MRRPVSLRMLRFFLFYTGGFAGGRKENSGAGGASSTTHGNKAHICGRLRNQDRYRPGAFREDRRQFYRGKPVPAEADCLRIRADSHRQNKQEDGVRPVRGRCGRQEYHSGAAHGGDAGCRSGHGNYGSAAACWFLFRKSGQGHLGRARHSGFPVCRIRYSSQRSSAARAASRKEARSRCAVSMSVS